MPQASEDITLLVDLEAGSSSICPGAPMSTSHRRWRLFGALAVTVVCLWVAAGAWGSADDTATGAFDLFRRRKTKKSGQQESSTSTREFSVSNDKKPKSNFPSRRVRQTKMEQSWHRNNEEYKRAMDPDTLFEGFPQPLRGFLATQARFLGKAGSVFQDPQEAKKALGIEGFSQY